MKYRDGFVSNSSSSSFVLNICGLSSEQKDKIFDHINAAKEAGWNTHASAYHFWSHETLGADFCKFSANMDNFDLIGWIKYVIGAEETEKRTGNYDGN
jgi:hypothetical protein